MITLIRTLTCGGIVFFWLLFSLSASFAEMSPESGVSAVSKTLLSVIDLSRWNPQSVVVSQDMSHVAYIQKTEDGRAQVIHDGDLGPVFGAVKASSLVFSKTGRLAYVVASGKNRFVVVDGSVSSAYDDIIENSFSFSDNGKRYAYVVKKKHKWFVVVDGELSKAYNRVDVKTLEFSSNSANFGYIARIGSKQVIVINEQRSAEYDNIWVGDSLFDVTGKRSLYLGQSGNDWAVTVDEKTGRAFDFVTSTSMQFDPLGKHVAYAAEDDGKWYVVQDGVIGPPYDEIRTQSLAFDPQGAHLAYAAKSAGSWTAVVDHSIVGHLYDDIDGIQPQFSPNGSQLAFGVRLGKQWGVVVDGTLGVPHTDIGHDTFSFSSDGEHFAYSAQLEGAWFMMLDGKPDQFSYGEIPMVDRSFTRLGTKGPVFSPNGKRFAYSVVQGLDKLGVVVDSQLGRPHWDLIEESLIFSPDSNKIGYVAGSSDSKWRVLVERKVVGGAYDGIGGSGVNFTPDSQHVVFAAAVNRKWVAVVDGEDSERYDHLLSWNGEMFYITRENQLRYVGRQGDKIYIVNQKIGAV